MKTLLFASLALAAAILPVSAQHKPAPPLPPGTDAHRNIEYVAGGGTSRSLDLFVPATPAGKLPVVVWIHGGAWRAGSKENCPALPFLTRGYAVASLNYRLTQEAIFPAQIHDCKAAIRWLRANAKQYRLDPDHIGVWGASAGGHLVALLGTSGAVKELEGNAGNQNYSSRVQAVCDWFGPTDFISFASKSGTNRLQNANSPEVQLLGGPGADVQAKARAASPVTYVSSNAPPFLIMHGDKDPLVPLDQSQILATALKQAGVDVTLIAVPGAGHGFGGPAIQKQVADFFDKHLKLSRAQ